MAGQTFPIPLERLIKLLAQDANVDPDVVMSEIGQNVRDSIGHRRKLTAGGSAAAAPTQPASTWWPTRIEHQDDPRRRVGTIPRRGCQVPASIVRSATSKLRGRPRAADRSRTADPISHFAIGPLSALIVRAAVEVMTLAERGEPLRFRREGCWIFSRDEALEGTKVDSLRWFPHPGPEPPSVPRRGAPSGDILRT